MRVFYVPKDSNFVVQRKICTAAVIYSGIRVAYFDCFGNLYFMCLKLLNELQDGGADQWVRRFIEKLNNAAPGLMRRGK